MDRNFRRITLEKIAENAGILTQTVQKAIQNPISPKPTFKTLGSVGPGTTLMMPANPVKADGSVDIVINIRGIAGGDVGFASSLGVNAVIISAEAGGLGSKQCQEKFGNAAFVNGAVSKVIGFLQKQFPDKNVHRGKLIVSGFSGGGGAIAQMLTQKDQIQGGLNGVLINDGLHANPGTPEMNAVLDYAKEAEKNPDKYKFSLIHSAVNPGKYISTTQTADYLLNQLNLQRKPIDQTWNGVGPKPVSQAKAGGFVVTQLYDKEQPYMAKDDKGQLRPNVMGKTSGGQHISALHWMPNAFKDIGLEPLA